jgi:hypothetical protein
MHELKFFGLHELKTGVPPTSIYSIELAASELRTIAATTGFEELKINYGLKTDKRFVASHPASDLARSGAPPLHLRHALGLAG